MKQERKPALQPYSDLKPLTGGSVDIIMHDDKHAYKMVADPHEVKFNHDVMKALGITVPNVTIITQSDKEYNLLVEKSKTLHFTSKQRRHSLDRENNAIVKMDYINGPQLYKAVESSPFKGERRKKAYEQMGTIALADAYLGIGDRVVQNTNTGT